MESFSFMKFFKSVAALTLGLALLGPASGQSVAGGEWSFDVYLDNKEIGYHHFELRELDNGQLLRSEADFKVKVLFITAFDYEHRNSELWNNGCLQSIDARTESNGKLFEVLGKVEDQQFVIETADGQATVDDCVATFAYWDRSLLARGRLLNSQTGEYLEVETTALPAAELAIGQRRVLTDRVKLSAKGLDLVVSYGAGTGEWLGLDSTLSNGRTLKYRRSPAELGEMAAIALSAGAGSEKQ